MGRPLDREELSQALVEAQRALAAERERRQQLEQLLAGVGPLTAHAADATEAFDRLIAVARPLLAFDHAAILEADDDGGFTATVATEGPLRGGSWRAGPAFARVLSGQTIAAFDLRRLSEWDGVASGLVDQISALHIHIPREGAPALLVCTHARRGFYTPAHVWIAERIVPLASQALSNVQQLTRLEHANRELVDARDAALQASRAKSTFLANMSHELRTPLNAILGYSELIAEQSADQGRDPWFLDDLRHITGAAEHLLGIISDVLDLAKIEAGHLTPCLEDVPLDEWLAGLVATVRPVVERRRNRLVVQVQGAPPRWVTDVQRARQVLLNLLSNAAKFTTGGEVRLVVRPHGEHLAFAVHDTGMGIATEDLERIFGAFEQVHAGSRPEGTGLGLPITRRLCEMLGGWVEVASTPHVGSVFTAYLAKDLRAALGSRARAA